MSLQFNDTTNKQGIIQKIERLCKLGDAGISGSTQKLKEFTADVNLAFDKVLAIIFRVGGRWQFDDSNHTKYPIITSALVSGQRDYSFTTDEQGNLVLEIYKVMIRQSATGVYVELPCVDQQSDEDMDSFYDGLNVSGIPSRYDKTANGIFLDCITNYNSDDGLKIFINREASYFTTSDTTKKPGFAGLYHKYLALEPSYEYAATNGLKNRDVIKLEMAEMEDAIKKHYRDRSKDEQPVMSASEINPI